MSLSAPLRDATPFLHFQVRKVRLGRVKGLTQRHPACKGQTLTKGPVSRLPIATPQPRPAAQADHCLGKQGCCLPRTGGWGLGPELVGALSAVPGDYL